MKVTVVKNKYQVQQFNDNRQKLLDHTREMLNDISMFRSPGEVVSVEISPTDKWYRTAMDLIEGRYGLREVYFDFQKEFKVFQQKVPDAPERGSVMFTVI
ncbi:hypothetical protein [Levilactobacillus senmaizukei]|uniref:hypothetical protein n=1 Tax=Levilactobacillus senmaizukei TaxID=431273 RepID=UPI00077C029C|nr:hypothetical protein [Levilactobacillus senmaizukei]